MTIGRNAARDRIDLGDGDVPDVAALSLEELDRLDNSVLDAAIRRILASVDRSEPPVAGFNSAI